MKLLLFAALVAAGIWLVRRMSAASGTRGDAARLLGVAPDAGAEEVLEAHRRLIARVHPDAGGSAELAAQLNRARDTMLRR